MSLGSFLNKLNPIQYNRKVCIFKMMMETDKLKEGEAMIKRKKTIGGLGEEMFYIKNDQKKGYILLKIQ